jgi:hypothetical protein
LLIRIPFRISSGINNRCPAYFAYPETMVRGRGRF